MKYIILPVLRFIWLIIHYLVLCPLLICAALLGCLWECKWAPLTEYLQSHFIMSPPIPWMTGTRYYYYKTGYDWLIQRKSYKTS